MSLTFKGKKPEGLRASIMESAEGSYNGAIIKAFEKVCTALDRVFEEAPANVQKFWTGKEIETDADQENELGVQDREREGNIEKPKSSRKKAKGNQGQSTEEG